ncbi:uncharacterized protein L969DRAFT_84093 [Mixia osmundae IAM 14324]|uniref:uncharacterized protein n=1 Tax=Mixia osmundae (strain CBS 9802 / IAM 14324 / JCM 22182 / KY 12970) TaxID=764103 RepID=UPI0004A55477|nr:uncharacterized protein L969DRAFT_84093 [Mixia osmundae IAM 14324]KEI42228.1 hypothetical protein L969DRAFT_84093 [Mixia osmundae IAM 14324]
MAALPPGLGPDNATIDALLKAHRSILTTMDQIATLQLQLQWGVEQDLIMPWQEMMTTYSSIISSAHSISQRLVMPPPPLPTAPANAYERKQQQDKHIVASKRSLGRVVVHPAIALEQDNEWISGLLTRTKLDLAHEARETAHLHRLGLVPDAREIAPDDLSRIQSLQASHDSLALWASELINGRAEYRDALDEETIHAALPGLKDRDADDGEEYDWKLRVSLDAEADEADADSDIHTPKTTDEEEDVQMIDAADGKAIARGPPPSIGEWAVFMSTGRLPDSLTAS